MSNSGKKKGPRPHQKVSRLEMAQNFDNVRQDIVQVRIALAWITDLVIEKGLFTQDELAAYFAKKRAEVEAAVSAQNAPPAPAPAEPSIIIP